MTGFDPAKDIPELDGKVILITGGNTGLGKESILQLARHSPAHIYMAARTESKANAAIEEISKAVPDVSISFLPCDLTSFESVRDCVNLFKSKSSRLDVLLNNAGIMATPMGETKEGYEIQFGTNHMGHFLLTKMLLPTLLSTAERLGTDVRIINVSSEGHQMAPRGKLILSTAELEKYSTWRRYGNSKMCNILFSSELARRHPSITSVSVHPGVILTDLYSSFGSSGFFGKLGVAVMGSVGKFILPDVHQGALTQLWAATAPKNKIINGAYYKPVGQIGYQTADSKSADLAKELWDFSEHQLLEKGY